ncbi:MAG: AAA family ATPase [Saprospiraceae bacterium]
MLEYIKIENYKSFRKMEIELQSINILIGANGAGKSNFISFFKLVKAIFNRRLQQFVLEEDKADSLMYFGRKGADFIGGKLIFSKNEEHNNSYLFQLAPTHSGGLYIDIEGAGYNVSRDDDSRNYFRDISLEESKVAVGESYRDKYLKKYFSEIQIFHFHDTSSSSRLRQGCDIEDNRYFKSDGRNLPAFLYLLKQKYPKVYQRIVRVVKSVAPFIEDFILEPSNLSHRNNKIELRWVENTDLDSNFSAYQFSDGTIRFIALATLLLQPNPPSIIIIDEPELGLHPFAISKLAGLIEIASYRAQIIISTQSVTLVDCFKPEDVITVDRNARAKQTIMKRLNSDQFISWLEEHKLGELWQRNIINAAQPKIK